LIEISFLGSGSSGNCAVVRCGKTVVLLDAGLSMRETKKRLALRGVALDEVRALFLTHEHADHAHAAWTLSRKLAVPIYATQGTAAAAGLPGPLFADVRCVRDGRDSVLAGGDLHVRATRTPHDGTESVCYVFADGAGRRVGVATDLGHLSAKVAAALRDCEVLGLEANHDVDLLRTGSYPVVLKRRILSDVGHLSNDAAATALETLIGPRTGSLAVLHISKHNNTPALAERTMASSVRAIGARVRLEVAPPDCPTPWLGAG